MLHRNHNPNGCRESVPTPGMRMHYHQCTKPVTTTVDGKKYCAIHDPVRIEQKQKERQEKLQVEMAERMKIIRLHSNAKTMLYLLRESTVSIDSDWLERRDKLLAKLERVK